MSKLSYYTKKNRILLYSIVAVIVIILCILLFRHIHSYGEWELYQEPTCSSYGVERRYCSCGEIQDRRLDMLPHTEGEWEFDGINSLRKKKCTVCGAIIKTESLANHSHSFSEWMTINEVTCASDGLQSRSCACGFKEEKIIKSAGHSFGDWLVTLSATCSKSGLMERSCFCGHIDTKEIEQLEHILGNWVLNGIYKEYPCINCGDILKSEAIKTSSGLKINGSAVVGIGACEDKDIVIPEEVNGVYIESINKKAFQYSNSIDSVIIPNSVKSIGSYAFCEVSSLKAVHFGNGLTDIGEHAFDSCANLLEISLPNGISVLRESTFTYCVSLNKVYIPKSVLNIETMVFYMCNNLTDVYYDGTLEEWHAINKDINWNVGIEGYTVHCVDGEIRY